MSDDKRYTLSEAKAELARQECSQYGHTWSEVRRLGDRLPSMFTCANCGTSVPTLTPAREQRIRDKERADWSSWLDGWASAVGPMPPTVEHVAQTLRGGPRPFGMTASEGDQ